MKDVSDLILPENLRYTETHEWARKEGDEIVMGLSDYAQDQLGDIVFVELPDVGDSFEGGGEFATVESVKAASEVYLPVDGTITAVNEELEGSPELVNGSPYEEAWVVRFKPANPADFENLMDVSTYRTFCGDQ